MSEKAFNPSEHLTNVRGKKYLEVKWRIVWFRDTHPSGSIVTDLLSVPGESPAVVKATVRYTDDDGREVAATGLGQQGTDDWSDWLEKAETRAVGRALASLGFGTQFCDDFGEAIVDAPVERAAPQPKRQAKPRAPQRQAAQKPKETGELATENQVKAIFAIANNIGFNGKEEIVEYAGNIVGREIEAVPDLTKAEASDVITSLQEFQH